MANLTSALTIKLIDDVSKPARSVSQALEEAAKRAQAVAKGMRWVEDAQEAGGALDKLNGSFKPNVDASAIQAAQAAAAQLLATLSAISGAASGAASAVAGIKVPSIGAAKRSSFTPGGDPGR